MHKLAVFGMVVFLLLAAQARRSAQGGETRPTGGAGARLTGRLRCRPGWREVMTEDFEGVWPGSGWTVTDVSNDGFQRYWGKEDFEPASATYPDWPGIGRPGRPAADACGRSGCSTLSRQHVDPDDLWPVRPRSAAAEIRFGCGSKPKYMRKGLPLCRPFLGRDQLWLVGLEGPLDWTEVPIDLASYTGDPSVWVRWEFGSDLLRGPGATRLWTTSPFPSCRLLPQSPSAAAGATSRSTGPQTNATGYGGVVGDQRSLLHAGHELSGDELRSCDSAVSPRQPGQHAGQLYLRRARSATAARRSATVSASSTLRLSVEGKRKLARLCSPKAGTTSQASA